MLFVSWHTLVVGYCVTGEVGAARRVFDGMVDKSFFSWSKSLFDALPQRNVVLWNTLIAGY